MALLYQILLILATHYLPLCHNKWEELTLIIWGVKITFLYYPFFINTKELFEWIQLPNIQTLAAMKFYTLGRRWKWKDYVDIYTILHSWYNFTHISKLSQKIFEGWYNEKLLREQLCYFDDIDYSEELEYIWIIPSDDNIKQFLCQVAVS